MSESIRAKKWGRKPLNQSNVPRKFDPKKLMDLALFYCSKRETSRPRLHAYLSRKVNLEQQPEAKEWIEEILKEFERTGIIDHTRFAGMITREYSRRGKGKRYIEQKLKEKGVGEQVSQIEFDSQDETQRAIESAVKMMQKTTLRKINEPHILKQKLLQKLIAAGFDYGTAKKAVEVALKK